MEKQITGHTVGINPAERGGLPLRNGYYAQDKSQKQQQHQRAADKTGLLAYGAVDKIGVLFGHKLQLRLSAVEIPLAENSAGAYGYL